MKPTPRWCRSVVAALLALAASAVSDRSISAKNAAEITSPTVLALSGGEHRIGPGQTERYQEVVLSGTARLILEGGTLVLAGASDGGSVIRLSGRSMLLVEQGRGTSRIDVDGPSERLLDAYDSSVIRFTGLDVPPKDFGAENWQSRPHIDFAGGIHLHDRSKWEVRRANLVWRNAPERTDQNLHMVGETALQMTDVNVPLIFGTHDVFADAGDLAEAHAEDVSEDRPVIELERVRFDAATLNVGGGTQLEAVDLRARDLWIQGQAAADLWGARLGTLGLDLGAGKPFVIGPVGEDLHGESGRGETTRGTSLGYRYNVLYMAESALDKRDALRPSVIAHDVEIGYWHFGLRPGAVGTLTGFDPEKSKDYKPLLLSVYPNDEHDGANSDSPRLPLDWGRLPAHQTLKNYFFPGVGGGIRVEGSRIDTWNAYVSGDSSIRFSADEVGELMVNGTSSVEVTNSNLQAAVLAVGGQSTLTLRDSTIAGIGADAGPARSSASSILLVSESARVRIADTRISACPIRATGDSRVEVVQSGAPTEIDVHDAAVVSLIASGHQPPKPKEPDGVIRAVAVRDAATLELVDSPASAESWLPKGVEVAATACFRARQGDRSQTKGCQRTKG